MTLATTHRDVFAGLKGALVDSLSKIAKEINSSTTSTAEYVRTLTATPDALQYVEELVIELFRSLCRCQPHATDGRYTTADIETRVNELFHSSIDRWVIGEAQSHVTSYKSNRYKKTLRLPVDRIHAVSKQVFGRLDYTVSVYVTSVLEYVAADILKMTGNYVKNTRANEIQRQDVKIALSVDKVLMNVLFHEGAEETALHSGQWPLPAPVEDVSGGVGATSKPSPRAPLSVGDVHGLTYTQSVRNFEVCERQYLRTLQLILKVFREPFYRQFPRSKDIEVIFSTIHDVYELAANIVSMLEDVFEGVTDEQNEPALIGSCFEDLAEAQEFDVYSKFAKDILTPIGRERLSALLQRNDVVQQLCIQNTVNGRPADQTTMRNAAKYLLPKLLLTPLCHFLSYTNTIYSLRDCARSEIAQLTQQGSGLARAASPAGAASASSASANAASLQQRTEDAEALDQCYGILLPIMTAIEKQLAQLALPTGNAAPVVSASLSGSQPIMSTGTDPLFGLSVAGELDHVSIDGWCNDPPFADAQAQPAGAIVSGSTAQTQLQGNAAASNSVSGSGPGPTSSSTQGGGVRRVSAYQFWYANQHLLNVYSGGAVRRRAAIDKLEELHRVVENWDRAAMSSRTVNEFLIEGCLAKWTSRSKQSERYAFLFDSVLLLCKFASSSKRSSLASQSIAVATPLAYGCVGVLPNAAGAVREYKFKERVPLARFEVIDRDDAPSVSGAERDDAAGALMRSAGSVCFELHYYEATASNPAARQSIVLCAKNAEEKQIWLAELVSLQTMSMLDRLLDAKLKEEEKLVPLPLPNDTRTYRFAEKDIEGVNIVFEENGENSGGEAQVLRGATLLKLVERLAYPWYVDLKFARTFLITYRDFCTPNRLLELLIERFSIPEPDLRALDQPPSAASTTTSLSGVTFMSSSSNLPSSSAFGSSSSIASSSISASTVDSGASSISSMAAKRFRQEYAKPIKMRVLNVIKQWVEHHYYDFDDDPTLLARLEAFLRECCETGSARYTRKGIESVRRKMREQQALYAGDGGARRSIHFDKSPPQIEWHLIRPTNHTLNPFSIYPPREFFMAMHPIEIARQSTLLEFETFREIKPNELIGSAWTKPNKNERSPNLMRMISYSNRFSYFLQHCVVDTENFDERCAVLLRILDVLQVFNDLNNFSGIFQVIAAIDSSAVHRLEHTMDYVDRSPRHARTLKECRELTHDHYRKYVDKLRMIDPPCVPFLGAYLTNLIHIEEGNPDYLRTPQPNNTGSTPGATNTAGSSLTVPSATGRSSPAVDPNDKPQTDAPDETVSAEDSAERQREGKDEDRLINFTKRRKLADIISEIKQCQQKPYCLSVEPTIRKFLEDLDPLSDCSEYDFQTRLFNKSLQIEPRNCRQPPRFPAKISLQISLKSPRVKPTATANSNTQPLATASTRVPGSLASAHSLSHTGSTSLSFHTRSQSHTAAQTGTPPLRSISPPSAHTHVTADSLSLASQSSLSTASKSRSASNTNVSSFSAFDGPIDSRRPDEAASMSDFSLEGLASGGSQLASSPVSAKDRMRRNQINASSTTLASAALDDVVSVANTNLSSATSTSTIASLRSTKLSINANADAMYNPSRTRFNNFAAPANATPYASYTDDTTWACKIDPSANTANTAQHMSSHTRLLHVHSLSDSSMVCDPPSSFGIATPSPLSSGAQTPDKSSRSAAAVAGGGSHQHLAAMSNLTQANFPRPGVASNGCAFPSPSASPLGSAHSASTDEVAPPLPPRGKPQRGDSHSSSGTSNSSNVPSAVPSPIPAQLEASFFPNTQPHNLHMAEASVSTAAPPALPPRLGPQRNRPNTHSFDFEEPPNLPPKRRTKARALPDHTESSSKSSLCDSPPVTGRRGSLQTNPECCAERAPPLPSRDRHANSRPSTAHSPAVSSRPHSHAAGGEPGSRNSTTSPTPIVSMGYSASQLRELDEARSSSPVRGGFMNIAPFVNTPGSSASLAYEPSLPDDQLQLDMAVEPTMPVDSTPQQVPPIPPKTYKKSVTAPPQKTES